jgi:hypothetical protein
VRAEQREQAHGGPGGGRPVAGSGGLPAGPDLVERRVVLAGQLVDGPDRLASAVLAHGTLLGSSSHRRPAEALGA